MTEPTHYEKHEKDEKENEKEEEKRTEKDEKSWDETWRRDPLGAAVWAFILIWAGVVLLGENLGLLAGLRPISTWELILVGAGLILLIEAVVRSVVPAYRRPVGGTVILAAVLLAGGLNSVIQSGVVWAVALIVLGAFLLLRGMGRRS
jgi:hypothetical protein